MYVDFKDLPLSSRIWIYQAERTFKADESNRIYERLKNFVTNWKRHGEDLKASFKILYEQFIVLAVDENYRDVSGCSIDASVQIVKDLEKEFGLDLLNKMKVSFKDGNNINTVSLSEFKEFSQQKKIGANTIVFNNMINSKADLDQAWEIEAAKSWHAKYLV